MITLEAFRPGLKTPAHIKKQPIYGKVDRKRRLSTYSQQYRFMLSYRQHL